MRKKKVNTNVDAAANVEKAQQKVTLASIENMKEEHEPEYINIYWDEWQ